MNKCGWIFAVIFISMTFVGCAVSKQPLHIHALEGDLTKVRTEIEGGTAVDIRDAGGHTALMLAAKSGRTEVVKYLVSKGADVKAESEFFLWTPLYYAASFNRVDVMEFLIANGANVDAPDKWGSTPLFAAASLGHVEAVKLLLDNGADTSIENRDNQTALDFARQHNQPAVMQLLENL